MTIAFKEWAVVCDALSRGQQILILRKGGIVEDGGRFLPDHPQFVLLPTYVHQSPEGIRPEFHADLERVQKQAPAPGTIELSHWAEITAATRVDSLEKLESLQAEHIWSDAVVQERYRRWQSGSVYALVVRVYALDATTVIADKPQYGGCKSWIELEEDIPLSLSQPVLDDETYHALASAILDRLQKDEG